MYKKVLKKLQSSLKVTEDLCKNILKDYPDYNVSRKTVVVLKHSGRGFARVFIEDSKWWYSDEETGTVFSLPNMEEMAQALTLLLPELDATMHAVNEP